MELLDFTEEYLYDNKGFARKMDTLITANIN